MDKAVANYISTFKSDMMLNMPFFGEVFSHVDIVENNSFETACTNGRVIYYNSAFLRSLKKGQRNYILLHELIHIILLHFKRHKGKEEETWNISADYVVNGMLEDVLREAKECGSYMGMPFERPPCGCFLDKYEGQSVEQLYNAIYADNKHNIFKYKIVFLRGRYSRDVQEKPKKVKLTPGDFDLVIELSEEEEAQLEKEIREIVDNAMRNWSKDPSSGVVMREISILKHDKRLPWKRLLRRYLMESDSDDISYDHPERKYLHMEMILPGIGAESIKTNLNNIWAFVDTSGSIDTDELNEFISQLYDICRQFDSTMNIGFWDTRIHEVYKNVSKQKIGDCKTCYSGGTDVNSVYDYLEKEKINPRVLLILTDGQFGAVREDRTKKYRNRTIVVLSPNSWNDQIVQMGKIAKL